MANSTAFDNRAHVFEQLINMRAEDRRKLHDDMPQIRKMVKMADQIISNKPITAEYDDPLQIRMAEMAEYYGYAMLQACNIIQDEAVTNQPWMDEVLRTVREDGKCECTLHQSNGTFFLFRVAVAMAWDKKTMVFVVSDHDEMGRIEKSLRDFESRVSQVYNPRGRGLHDRIMVLSVQGSKVHDLDFDIEEIDCVIMDNTDVLSKVVLNKVKQSGKSFISLNTVNRKFSTL